MKKVLKASLIVAAAFAFGCAAAACGDDDNNKPPQEPAKVTVSFDLNYTADGVTNPESQTVNKGETITEPDDVAERTGWDLEGWYVGSLDGDKFDFDSAVSADTTLVANWTIADGYYAVTFASASGTTGTAPATQAVAAGATITIPANPFTKTGWEFYRWKNMTAGTYLVSNDVTISADTEFRAVFSKEYSYFDEENYYYGDTTIKVFDDGYLAEDAGYGDGYGDPAPYSVNPWYDYLDVTVESYGMIVRTSYKINNDGTFAVADGMQFADIIADDGFSTLLFDGFGNVELDGHEGTYEYDYGDTITLKFGDDVYEDLPLGFDDYYAVNAITAEITIDGTTYTFGAAGEPWDGEIPTKYVGTYEGEAYYGEGTNYVVVIAADKITVKIDDAEPVEAVIMGYDVEEDIETTIETFTLKLGENTWFIKKNVEEDGTVQGIVLQEEANRMNSIVCSRPTEGGDEE